MTGANAKPLYTAAYAGLDLLDESRGLRRQTAIAYPTVNLIQVIENNPGRSISLNCAPHDLRIEAADATHLPGDGC